MTDVLAIACSDIHLSHIPPRARAGEKDWYEAMARQLAQLWDLQSKYECPIVCAGDVFHKWNAPAELINFAIANLPVMYSVPGQHDLPWHRYDLIERSAYWTLVEAGRLIDIEGGHCSEVDNPKDFVLCSFPWGFEVDDEDTEWEQPTIALIHAYCHKKGHSFPGAPKENASTRWKKKTQQFDFAVFGDNHKGFVDGKIINCGGFMLRNSDEADRHPFVGLLCRDGSIKKHMLDTSEDIIDLTVPADNDDELDASAFVDEMNEVAEAVGFRFEDVVREWLKRNKVGAETQQLMLEALEQ